MISEMQKTWTESRNPVIKSLQYNANVMELNKMYQLIRDAFDYSYLIKPLKLNPENL